jgi:beta-aspartyl-dipeptidase (metallo-type)
MAFLIRGGTVYAPRALGRCDILVAGTKVEAVGPPGSISGSGFEVVTIDAQGMSVLPALIDPHVHILGGGGEGGPATRAPEITVEAVAAAGIATVIGCLGTDGVTRHMASLLAKARALEVEGLNCFLLSGSYEIPVRTLTGSVRSDLVLIEKIVGAGEIAVSDHRSSQPTFEEIAKLAAECRVGGLLGGKAGILVLHLGDGPRGLEPLRRLRAETEIPAGQVVPTHCNRSRRLLEEALEYIRTGGLMDLTAGIDPEEESDDDVSVETAVRLCLERCLPLERVTVSSDGNGSLPAFDKDGRVASPRTLLRKLRSLVGRGILGLEQAAGLFAANPAAIYKLAGKGLLTPGADADILVLDGEMRPTCLLARGRTLMAGGRLLARSTFAGEGDGREGGD